MRLTRGHVGSWQENSLGGRGSRRGDSRTHRLASGWELDRCRYELGHRSKKESEEYTMSNADSVNKCYELLLEEHARLRGLLAELKQILLERTAGTPEVSRRFRELSELIDDHFKAEEDSQCFAELVSHAPRVSDRVNELIAEHGELREKLPVWSNWQSRVMVLPHVGRKWGRISLSLRQS